MSEANGQELPKGWASTKLGEIVLPRTGKADPQATPEAKFIGMEQVEAHTMRLLGTVPASSMKSSANVFQPHDVLYRRLRAYLNKVYQPDFVGLCSGEFIVLPETSAVHGRFLKYRLNSGDFVRFASQINTGDRPRVDWDQIKTFGVALPPKFEQERISDTLDELLSDLDAGAAALERGREKLKHYRAAVLKAAVEGALTAEWRRQHPPTEPASARLTRILLEHRRRWEEAQLQRFQAAGKSTPKDWKAKYREPNAPYTTNLSLLPEGWCWATLDALGFVTKLAGFEFTKFVRYTATGDLPVIKAENVTKSGFREKAFSYVDSKTVSSLTRSRVYPNDLLMAFVGSVGQIARVPAGREYFLGPNVALIRILSGELGAAFCEHYLRSPSGFARTLKLAKATSQPSISMGHIRTLSIPVPPLIEQEAIVEAAEDQLSLIEHLEADLEAKLMSAQALRQSILRRAFTGQLVPQDLNDEPACELLQRIAAEREERARQAKAAKQAKTKTKTSRARPAKT